MCGPYLAKGVAVLRWGLLEHGNGGLHHRLGHVADELQARAHARTQCGTSPPRFPPGPGRGRHHQPDLVRVRVHPASATHVPEVGHGWLCRVWVWVGQGCVSRGRKVGDRVPTPAGGGRGGVLVSLVDRVVGCAGSSAGALVLLPSAVAAGSSQRTPSPSLPPQRAGQHGLNCRSTQQWSPPEPFFARLGSYLLCSPGPLHCLQQHCLCEPAKLQDRVCVSGANSCSVHGTRGAFATSSVQFAAVVRRVDSSGVKASPRLAYTPGGGGGAAEGPCHATRGEPSPPTWGVAHYLTTAHRHTRGR